MLLYELKIFISDYKKILILLVTLIIFFLGIAKIISDFEKRGYIFEPFTVGVDNSDNSSMVNKVFNIYNSTNKLSKTIYFKPMSLADCKAKLKDGSIPAYISVPSNFTSDINTGKNTPVTIVCNENKPIETSIIKFVVETGISFLTTSQSGIYGTIDYSRTLGISEDTINSKIVMPINIRYGLALLSYNNYFHVKTVSSTGKLSYLNYYALSFFIFFLMLISSSFMSNIFATSNRNILQMYKRSKKELAYFTFLKIISLTIVLLIISIPAIFYFKAKTIIICFFVSSFVILISSMFSDILVTNIVLIISSFLFVYVSGGLIPNVFLPKIIVLLGKFTPNYYLLQLSSSMNYFYCLLYFSFSFALTLLFYKRKLNNGGKI